MRRQKSSEGQGETNAGSPGEMTGAHGAPGNTLTVGRVQAADAQTGPRGNAPPDQNMSVAQQITSLREMLPKADLDALGDNDRLALLRELELLTRTVAGVGVSLQVSFYTSQVATQIADGIAPSRAGRAAPDDLAQARLTSPYWGSRELTCAKALVGQMPRTLAALQAGVINAHQARVVTEATTCVDAADRAEIDERLAPLLAGASTQEIGALARGLVYELDPAGFVARARKAAADRGVSIRPCPDVMGLLSARLPAPQAIACYQSLRSTAEAMKASGDPRTLAQLMADALYERLTGRTVVDGIDIEVGLVITDEALLAGTSDAAILLGYGPIPAQTARDLLNPTTDTGTAEAAETDADQDDAVQVDTVEGDARPYDAAHGGTENGAKDDVAGTDPIEDSKAADQADADLDEAARGARDDAARNSAGFAGGSVPAGYCSDGPRCTSFSCTLTHGHPAAGAAPAPPDLGSLTRSGRAPSTGLSDHESPNDDEPDVTSSGESSVQQHPVRHHDSRANSGRDPAQEPQTAAARAAIVWVRRLYTDPVTGVLTDRDNRKRLFTGALRAFLISRDQTCRNTWCGAPVRHVDHVQRHSDHGATDPDNGQGLCARCNLARERPRQLDTPPSTYRSPPPLLPCLPRPEHRDSDHDPLTSHPGAAA